jgi:RNA polymerase subunit RPABC4/transcription elongation factor Spt4
MDERRQCPQCRTDVEADDSACPFCGVALKTAPLPSARGWAKRPALKPCPDCGATVSVRAESCPQCGCPTKRRPTRGGTLVSALVGAFAVIVLFNMMMADRRGAMVPLNAPRVAPGGRAVLDCKGGDGA